MDAPIADTSVLDRVLLETKLPKVGERAHYPPRGLLIPESRQMLVPCLPPDPAVLSHLEEAGSHIADDEVGDRQVIVLHGSAHELLVASGDIGQHHLLSGHHRGKELSGPVGLRCRPIG